MQRSHTLIARAGILVAVGTLAAVLSVVPALQWLSVAVTIATLIILGWLVAGQAKEAAAQRTGAGALRALNVDLEGLAQTGAADALASSERLRSIIHSAVDGIIVIDQTGHIESFNPAAERLFGYAQSEVAGRNVNMLMPSPYHEEHDSYLRRYLTTGNAKIIGVGREVTGRRRDGSVFPLHLSVGQMTIGGERKFTGIVHDLTGRVRLEEQLREQTALARIGEMAAAIAHEVKNPLAGIRGVIQVLGGRTPEGSRDRMVLGDIVKRIDALDVLMKDLLLFGRSPQPRRSSVDVVPLVKMTAHLICQDPLLKDVDVTVEGASPPLLADAEMLKIVFQNLFVNAAHAMTGGGKIAVVITATDSVCEVAVADTGPGIPADIRDKVFTAFFTTKSRGSGLGLATAKRLVEAHQGEIRIECPPGGGTTVRVRLPVDTEARTGPASSQAGVTANR